VSSLKRALPSARRAGRLGAGLPIASFPPKTKEARAPKEKERKALLANRARDEEKGKLDQQERKRWRSEEVARGYIPHNSLQDSPSSHQTLQKNKAFKLAREGRASIYRKKKKRYKSQAVRCPMRKKNTL